MMIEITEEDRTALITAADLKEFVNEVARLLCPKLGEIVPEHEVVGLHSESVCEDGTTILRLYDLRGGHTGAQSFLPGDAHGAIRYCS